MALQVISFYQDGCMACQEQEPINKEIEKALNIRIEAINPLKNRSYISQYSLHVTPTVLVIRDGEVVARFEGVVHREELEAAIKKNL